MDLAVSLTRVASVRVRSVALPFILAIACATAPLDAASDAYTALYGAMADAAQSDEDLARLDRMEDCWRVLYSWARSMLAAGEDPAAIKSVLVSYLLQAGEVQTCTAALGAAGAAP